MLYEVFFIDSDLFLNFFIMATIFNVTRYNLLEFQYVILRSLANSSILYSNACFSSNVAKVYSTDDRQSFRSCSCFKPNVEPAILYS